MIFLNNFNVICPVQPHLQKYTSSSSPQITPTNRAIPSSRVVLAPVAGVKLAEERRPNRVLAILQSAGDGGKRNSSPGRARYKPSNHCAGNAGVLQLYLYARVRTLRTYCTRDRGCSKHPAFPAPSSSGRMILQSSGAMRREIAEVCLRRMGGAQRYPSMPMRLAMGIAALHPSYGLYLRHPEERALARVSKGGGHQRGCSSFEARFARTSG